MWRLEIGCGDLLFGLDVCPANKERIFPPFLLFVGMTIASSACLQYIFRIYDTMNSNGSMGELVGDFYVHLVDGAEVSKDLTSSTKLLTSKKIPTVMHFYDGG